MNTILFLSMMLFIPGYLLTYVILRDKIAKVLKEKDKSSLEIRRALVENILVRWYRYMDLFDETVLFRDEFRNLLLWTSIFILLTTIVWVFKYGF